MPDENDLKHQRIGLAVAVAPALLGPQLKRDPLSSTTLLTMRYAIPILLLLACARSGSDRTDLPQPRADTLLARRDTIRSKVAGLYKAFIDSLVDVRPTVVRCPPVKYPETLRRAGIQGQVVVALIIDTLGHPEPSSLRAVESSHDSMSIAALEAVQGCEFTPARLHGRAVRVLIQLPLDFKIHPS